MVAGRLLPVQRVALLLVLAAVAAAWGSAPAAGRATGEACATDRTYGLTSKTRAFYAEVRTFATAFRRPGRRPFASFERLNVNGVPTVFGILGAVVGRDCVPRWFRVQLPMKPNGVEGYVRADAVDVGEVDARIVIDLSDREVTFYRRGREVLRAPAAVGSPATPTPTGRYYVNQRLIPYDTSGPFGPGAIGISAFSEVLTGWEQGGPIAIHGTNKPWLIGRAVSAGCIRVSNSVIRRVWRFATEGTVVVIRA